MIYAYSLYSLFVNGNLSQPNDQMSGEVIVLTKYLCYAMEMYYLDRPSVSLTNIR